MLYQRGVGMKKNSKPTNPILAETQKDSEMMVDKKIRAFQVIEILSSSTEPMSAKEIAVEMCNRGYTPTSERNFSSPRITELMKKDIVECVKKKICQYTGKPVGTFKLKRKEES